MSHGMHFNPSTIFSYLGQSLNKWSTSTRQYIQQNDTQQNDIQHTDMQQIRVGTVISKAITLLRAECHSVECRSA